MKSTGIVRKLDELGRIVLPMEIRKSFDLAEKDPIEIYTNQDMIILRKFHQSCVFCNSTENILAYKGKPVCSECLSDLMRKE